MQSPHEQFIDYPKKTDATTPAITELNWPDLSDFLQITAWVDAIMQRKAANQEISLDKEKTGTVLLAFITLLYDIYSPMRSNLEWNQTKYHADPGDYFPILGNILSLNPALDWLHPQSGKTVFHYAVKFPTTDWLAKLLEINAVDTNISDKNVIRQKKVDINIRDKRGVTPLHEVLDSYSDDAVAPRNNQMIELLLKNGADYNIFYTPKKTLLDKAINNDNFSARTIVSFIRTSVKNFSLFYFNACVTPDAEVWFIVFTYLVTTGYLHLEICPPVSKMLQYRTDIKRIIQEEKKSTQSSEIRKAENSLLEFMKTGMERRITTENEGLAYFERVFQVAHQNIINHSEETGQFILEMRYFLKTGYLDNPSQRWEVLQLHVENHISKNKQCWLPPKDNIDFPCIKSPIQRKFLLWDLGDDLKPVVLKKTNSEEKKIDEPYHPN